MPEPAATAVHHVGLTVSSLERALAFWRDGLAATVVMEQAKEGGYFEQIVGEPGVRVRMAQLALPGGGARVELFEFSSPRGGRHVSRPADVGFAHVCVTTADLGGLLERLVAAGGSPLSAPVSVDTGANAGGRALYVRDPDGHVLEVFEAPR